MTFNWLFVIISTSSLYLDYIVLKKFVLIAITSHRESYWGNVSIHSNPATSIFTKASIQGTGSVPQPAAIVSLTTEHTDRKALSKSKTMCNFYQPQYRCHHYGPEIRSCPAEEDFHGECEGVDPNVVLITRQHCCSEDCCRAAVRKQSEAVSRIENDAQGQYAGLPNEHADAIERVRERLGRECEYHQEVCYGMTRERTQRVDGWVHRGGEVFDSWARGNHVGA